ncbi:YciI family protein [Kineosporia sp. NBRC 101731]|uniref:YciI family protein n=1 Tax=Kineosporia sp. NBRC 101731 TaxID=3032199 RepID=UPI00255509CE|nr:YciI family protein [Kineosporia sp. NBRC 101731]
MTRYLISFDDGAMTFPAEELPDVARASMAVVEEARAAGVWVFGGGVIGQGAKVVSTDGSVADYALGEGTLGGFSIVDVSSLDEALVWAGRIAVSCRCAQKVRELMADPDLTKS